MITAFSRVGFFLLVLFSTACTQQFTVESPVDDSVLTSKPNLFKVSFAGGIPAGLKLVLNSTDVTNKFTITELGAEANGLLLADNVFSGKNQFSAVAGIIIHNSIFYYDDTGPAIHVTTANHTEGTVAGYLADPSGVVSLSIDGANVPVDANGAFNTSFTSMDFNEFTATDTNGYQSTVTYARRDQEFFPSISARLNNGGFSFLADQLMMGLGDYDFQSFMNKINPIIDGFGYSGSLDQFQFDKPDISLVVLDDEKLDVHIDIPNFTAALKITVLFITIRGSLSVDNLVIDTEALIDIIDSDVSLSISNTSLVLDGLDIDLNSEFIESIAEGMVDDLMPVFIDVIEQVAIPILSDFIGEILVEVDITTTDGEVLHGKISPTYLDTFDQGLTVDFGAAMSAPEPALEAVPQIGSLYKAGDIPSLGASSPDGSAFDVGASISANLINQALFAAHEAGITTMTLTPDNTAGTSPEGVAVIQSEEDDIQTEDLIVMKLLPASPPFIKLMQGNNLHGLLGWYDVTFEFELKRVGWDEYQNVFQATFNLEVPFELGATDDGFLHIGIEQLPAIEVLASDNAGPIKLTPTFINSIIEYAMPVVLPTLAVKLDSIPLPRVGGYSIHADELWVSGSGDSNFSLAGSLVKLTTTEQAAAPTTSLDLATSTVVNVQNGEATIDVSEGSNTTAEPLEYRYRVDGGGWSNWKRRDTIKMRRLFGGHHTVEVCSRTILMKQEVDCPTAEFDTTIMP